MQEIDKFLATLFKKGEQTCFSDGPYGTTVKEAPSENDIFYCINPLHPNLDLNPHQEWHSPNTGRRADLNVSAYRNFLIEIDDMPLDEQIKYVTSKVPVTSIVYSGGKSNHFIIALENEVSFEDYKTYARRLKNFIPAMDPTTKNPSRLSRLPYRYRADRAKRQELLYLGAPISEAQLDEILPPVQKFTYKGMPNSGNREFISAYLISMMENPEMTMLQLGLGGRNALFHYLGQRLKDGNVGSEKSYLIVEKVYYNLRNKDGFSFEEACNAARVRG